MQQGLIGALPLRGTGPRADCATSLMPVERTQLQSSPCREAIHRDAVERAVKRGNRAALGLARSWLSGAAHGTWLEHCSVCSYGSKMKV